MGTSTKSFNIAGGITQATGSMTCRIHPVAVVTILDADLRRPEGAVRTIGTLLGFVTEGNVLEITDAFPVPHQDAEDRNVLMDQDYHRTMVALMNKVPPKENVIGWFSTGSEITDSSVIIDSFYSSPESGFSPGQVLQGPLHLLVNTSICEANSLPIKAYIHQSTHVAQKLAQFHEIPSEVKTDEQGAKMGLAWLYEAIMKSKTKDMEHIDIFSKGLSDLETQFHTALQYIASVQKGEIVGDVALGRAISRALEEAPDFNTAPCGERSLASSSVLDSLMVVYLANLTQVQTSLAEKISGLAPMEN